MSALLNALVDRRSEPSERRVLDDMLAEQGVTHARLGVALWVSVADVADADVSDAAVSDADVSDASDAADAADVSKQIRHSLYLLLTKEIDMRNGLKVIQVPGRYGYSVTLVGWLRRESGDEFTLHNAVTVVRTGGYRLNGLQTLASDGPGKRGYDVTEPCRAVEEIHRLLVRRSFVANEAAWAEKCPKPKGWVE